MSIMVLKESLTSVRIWWMASRMDFRNRPSSVWRHLSARVEGVGLAFLPVTVNQRGGLDGRVVTSR